jgi:hypothetical protein
MSLVYLNYDLVAIVDAVATECTNLDTICTFPANYYLGKNVPFCSFFCLKSYHPKNSNMGLEPPVGP